MLDSKTIFPIFPLCIFLLFARHSPKPRFRASSSYQSYAPEYIAFGLLELKLAKLKGKTRLLWRKNATMTFYFRNDDIILFADEAWLHFI